jgi:hypothetical protein
MHEMVVENARVLFNDIVTCSIGIDEGKITRIAKILKGEQTYDARNRLVLPGAIDTEIWDQPGNDPPVYQGPLEPAADVANGIIDAIEGDRFEHYLPDLKAIVEYKTSDIDTFMAGAADMVRQNQAAERAQP